MVPSSWYLQDMDNYGKFWYVQALDDFDFASKGLLVPAILDEYQAMGHIEDALEEIEDDI
jgi:hypothetical protein